MYPYPPFAYSKNLNVALRQFPVTPQNSPPALIVLLCLVTHPALLNALDGINDPNTDFDFAFTDAHGFTFTVDSIASMANLTRVGVQDMLRRTYLKAAAGPPTQAEADMQASFFTVGSKFQSFEGVRVAVWDPNTCPGYTGISTLAHGGAGIDPLASARVANP